MLLTVRGRQRLMLQPRGEGAHIITGGLGRIGLVLAQRLTGLGCNVVLTTRGHFPARARWAEIASRTGYAPDEVESLEERVPNFLERLAQYAFD